MAPARGDASAKVEVGIFRDTPWHAGFRRRARHEVVVIHRERRDLMSPLAVCPEGCQALSAKRFSPARLAVKMEQLIQDPDTHFCGCRA